MHLRESKAGMDLEGHARWDSKVNILLNETEKRKMKNVKRSQELMINHRNHLKMLISMNESKSLLEKCDDEQ